MKTYISDQLHHVELLQELFIILSHLSQLSGDKSKHLLLLFSHQFMSDFHDPMSCSPPGSSIHGISQAKLLEWVAISFSRGSSQSRDLTCFKSLPSKKADFLPLSHLESPKISVSQPGIKPGLSSGSVS